jgi:hypothetical protein
LLVGLDMKKKLQAKFVLTRETLRSLATSQLNRINAGIETGTKQPTTTDSTSDSNVGNLCG